MTKDQSSGAHEKFRTRAMERARADRLAAARELWARAAEVATESGEFALATMDLVSAAEAALDLAEPSAAERYVSAAIRAAANCGEGDHERSAKAVAAQLEAYLGGYRNAARTADNLLADGGGPVSYWSAIAVQVLGHCERFRGDVDAAVRHFDESARRFGESESKSRRACALLDSAEALLDRDGPSDASAASSRIADARDSLNGENPHMRRRLELLQLRGRYANGDVDGALAGVEPLVEAARASSDREVEWLALAFAGAVHGERGADFVARRQDVAAVEVLESIAMGVPVDRREGFWDDPRRRAVRARVDSRTNAAISQRYDAASMRLASPDQRTVRLLEIIKRLASEHDVDRLLERITESAVELSGAERGFVLLLDREGKLLPRTAKDARGVEDPHVVFSQSIAEAVLIDGEPIITVDARDDRRLSEYMSVHQLMLKSVACLPISSPRGPIGVLYLEHRMRRGRFREADVDTLFAFADQAAIAIENARLIAENVKRRDELEQANDELGIANREIERLLQKRTAELQDTKRELDRARDQLRTRFDQHGIVGRSEPMRKVFAIVDRVRDAAVPVVIHGESGTGKELIARAIHYRGGRAKKPFVAVNCAAIPDPLLESELFGHVRGAFTGAERDKQGVILQSSGGTLFLDEVGDMPPKMQVDLLRVLQERKVRPIGSAKEHDVDLRVIAASNKLLTDLVAKGDFREDLYYRLNVVELQLPPLRDRPDDIPLLAEHFLTAFAKRDGAPQRKLSREAMATLMAHSFPGNVRQLEHTLLSAWVMSDGDTIDAADLRLGTTRAPTPASTSPSPAAAPVSRSLTDFKNQEREQILTALHEHKWNRVRAAKSLGIPRRTFYRRLKEYNILQPTSS